MLRFREKIPLDETQSSAGEVGKKESAAWVVPTGRRTDEWSECLVEIAEKQDRAAYTRLFRHFAPLIKAFALSGSALSATHADELVQEVMLKIWQKASAFNPEKAAASTWVYTIARNCRTDMFRRLQKFDTPLAAEDFSLDQSDEEPFVQLQHRRSADRIKEMMAKLPADQTQILAKVYMEGKSHAEAAAELDLPLGTVKSRVRLAVQKMQVHFDKLPGGGSER
ncbi:MAG: sigma-70 family RNA polymerase sigma factor [Congregibacter sp.]